MMTLKPTRMKAFALSIIVLDFLTTVNCFGATYARQGASEWFKTEQTQVRLISATRSIGNNNMIHLGLQFKLKGNWKIYWRTPGDAGFPPRLDWKNSSNLKITKFDWPAPVRFKVLGFQTIGYKKEVVFPIAATLQNTKQPLRLQAELNYLTCDDVCIPYKTNLKLDLPSGDGSPTEHLQLINEFMSKVPGDGSADGLTIKRVEIAGDLEFVERDIGKGFIRVIAKSAVPFKNPDIFVEGPELAFFSLPRVKLEDSGKRAVIVIPFSVEEAKSISPPNLTLTIKDGERSATQTHAVVIGPPITFSSLNLHISFPIILGLALIGGIILNLMPCVLPVISLKILGLVSYGGAEYKIIRMSFVASSLGILFSFLVIASVLAGLKLTGTAVGWGIQFQHPWFIVGLTIIVSLFAYNLWGLFEVHLPYWLGNIAGRPLAISDTRQSFGNNFATGAFATILATPCSAPFLGTAVGFALAGSMFDIYVVFTALGIGMALPYLLVAIFPALASKLPKPGDWMFRVKQILGAALAVTAVWLIFVLAIQLDVVTAAVVGGLMVSMGGVLFSRRYMTGDWNKLATIGILVLVICAFALPYQYDKKGSKDLNSKNEAHWLAFAPAEIHKLVAEGKTVFVDVTARWCITCQVNKVTVLNRGKIFWLLSGRGEVVAMRGDWTRPDPRITSYLNSFGRAGIPFNVVYGPNAKEGIVLPELLTTGIVWDSLSKASGGAILAGK